MQLKFSCHIYKVDKFCDVLFAFLQTLPLLKKGLTYKERICTFGAFETKSFFAVYTIQKGGKTRIWTQASPESVSMPYNMTKNDKESISLPNIFRPRL